MVVTIARSGERYIRLVASTGLREDDNHDRE